MNRHALDQLGSPRQIQLLIHEERRILLLRTCSVGDREAVVVPPLAREQLEISGPSLLKRIRRLTGWTDDRPRQITGTAIPAYGVIAFDLRAAVPVRLKTAGGGAAARSR